MTRTAQAVRVGGVRAVVLPDAPHVSIGLAVPVGFALDPVGAPGLAHVCEHAVPAAVPHAVMGSFAIAAVTSCHHTTFVADVMPEEVGAALRAFAALTRPDPARLRRAVERERPVVALELSMTAGAAGHGVGAAVAELLVPQTGLGRELDATPDTVREVSPEGVLSHVEEHYGARSATLVLAGPVTGHHLDTGLELFPGGPPRPEADAPPARAPGPVPAWGIAHTHGPRHADPRPAWQDCLDEALIRPGSPADRLARSMAATPLGAMALRCPRGDLVLSAYRGEGGTRNGAEAAAALRDALLSEEHRPKVVSTAVAAAAQGYAARRSRMDLPWHVRDALLAEATGTGPRWEQWTEPYDQALATKTAESLLDRMTPWPA
ncbi:hypothetical protein SUDANB99_05817 [Streptomyces sp. enrichment culture]